MQPVFPGDNNRAILVVVNDNQYCDDVAGPNKCCDDIADNDVTNDCSIDVKCGGGLNNLGHNAHIVNNGVGDSTDIFDTCNFRERNATGNVDVYDCNRW
jgi:hypothetical protein